MPRYDFARRGEYVPLCVKVGLGIETPAVAGGRWVPIALPPSVPVLSPVSIGRLRNGGIQAAPPSEGQGCVAMARTSGLLIKYRVILIRRKGTTLVLLRPALYSCLLHFHSTALAFPLSLSLSAEAEESREYRSSLSKPQFGGQPARRDRRAVTDGRMDG